MSKHIEELSWEELHAYQFDAGHENITIITNAEPEQIQPIWKKFCDCNAAELNLNFVELVRQNGFVAVDAMTEGRLNY